MGLSKSTRIIILLCIDICFFLLELIVGYAVHSLALVADSFHMLNDVLSLFVGLWAVKVANRPAGDSAYTYGWQRAETLGALVNGVFLVALCVTIFLDAIQRFVEPQIVTNPKLVLIVGSLGLASNLIGLFLFHDHGHSHGSGGGHGHSHGDEVAEAEEGHAGHSHAHGSSTAQQTAEDRQAADQSGNVADVLPQNRIGGWPKTQPTENESSEATTVIGSPLTHKPSTSSRHGRTHSRSQSRRYSQEVFQSPYAFRNSIIEAARDDDPDDTHAHNEDAIEEEGHDSSEQDGLLPNGHSHANGYGTNGKHAPIDHSEHNHRQPKEAAAGGGHGHSHGDLNMRGVFLHVMGDALGNIGVIATALFIWLTDWSWRYYLDPAISLIITMIILASAWPLCKAASRILLQAVPLGISIEDIKADIKQLPGIVDCHHVHVWQLSDTKLIASLHVQVSFELDSGDGSARYMQLAIAIRQCLHEFGIHSSTIQPEFCLNPDHTHAGGDASSSPAAAGQHSDAAGSTSKTASLCEPDGCLLECGDDCNDSSKACCIKPEKKTDAACGHVHGS